tara:strand:- start:132 stop:650 length:519 start_codon:yes stop_codon:yes gene_type:complete
MKKQDLFPTPLWHVEGTPQKLVDDLYQGAYRFKDNYESVSYSNKGGYQSPAFKWKDFHPEGRQYMEDVVSNIVQDLYDIDWWININGKGHWNAPHTHAACDLAIVWYLTDSDGLLTIMNPHAVRFIPLETSVANIDAKKGDIVMFPADAQHYVLPNERDSDRISISMNLRLL